MIIQSRQILVSLFLFSTAGEAYASGFYIRIKSPESVALSSAGDAARTNDASTAFFNPAGMTHSGTAGFEFGVDLIRPSILITSSGSTATTPGSLGIATPVSGNAGKANDAVLIPSLFYVRPLSEEIAWGLAIATPFGLEVDYGTSWFGRYDSIRTALSTIDVSPSLAWRLNPSVSLGAGLNVQYADAELSNAVPNPLQPGGIGASSDAMATVDGDGWGAGFNVGALFRSADHGRFGLHYRSGIKHELDGRLAVKGLSGPLVAGNEVAPTRTAFRLPAVLSFAWVREVDQDWTLLAQWQWFEWKKFDAVRIHYNNDSRQVIRPQLFKNSTSFALGTKYRLSERWTVSTGIRSDRSPTVDGYRNSSIPDANMQWIGAGASYRFKDQFKFELGASRSRAKGAGIDLGLPFFDGSPVASIVSMKGQIRSRLSTISASIRYTL